MVIKVYLPCIEGYVPPQMLRAFSAFLEFCYLVRRNILNEKTLNEVDAALARYHHERTIFEQEGVCPSGFSLPRQHSLVHYRHLTQQFGAPNGLCSSITESKHIKAVKEPWRRSSRFNALGQMLITNQRLDKLAAARVDFDARGMLKGPCLSSFVPTISFPVDPPASPPLRAEHNDADGDDGQPEARPFDGPKVQATIKLAKKPGKLYSISVPLSCC